MGKRRAASRIGWGLLVGVPTAALICAGLVVAWPRPAKAPLERGQIAYTQGDWPTAAAEARSLLKEKPDDLEGVRLLARSLARQRKDESVRALFGHLGRERMQAEDLFLLGSVLARQGQAGPSLGLIEKAVRADPEHTEAAYELTRLYAGTRHFSQALELAEALAKKPGWQVKAGVALALLRRQFDDPLGAADAMAGALEADAALWGAPWGQRMPASFSLAGDSKPANPRGHRRLSRL